MSILKLSYNNLEPSVKSCFRYCALFPKDFEMNKRELINLWMAQGYTDDSEDCFIILLKRCFFQDVRRDEFGDILSLKMHDLIHDLAQEVAGDEIIAANSLPNNLSKKLRHLFIDGEVSTISSFHESNIRTCYMKTMVHCDMVKPLTANWRCLRSLRLYMPKEKNLPESIGELLHLRYLDLSHNKHLRTLPDSIVKLYNLESLILYFCPNIEEWPKDFCKLVNLRLLDIPHCRAGLPLGIDQLTNLHELSYINFGARNSGKQIVGQLNDLKLLVNLRGQLDINVYENFASDKENKWQGGYLEQMNLKYVRIFFENNNSHAVMIEKLQPNRNLMQLSLYHYNGSEIPRWGRPQDDWATILPNLVTIVLKFFKRLDGIPLLSNLKHLKSLTLEQLDNLEYMETSAISRGGSRSKDLPFFPSLEYLCLWRLKRLKGWWGGIGEGDQPPFPRLSILRISCCPKLTSFPPCPSLKSLGVSSTNIIVDDEELESLSEIEEVFKSCSALKSLEIKRCERLRSVSGALEHLTALESLSLSKVPLLDEQVDDDMLWRSLRHNLRSLELDSPGNLQILPTWMRHLTALQTLCIRYCNSLICLPEWISCLSSLDYLSIISCTGLKSLGSVQNITSLQELVIIDCTDLRTSGKEWQNNVRHIPHIRLSLY